MSEQYEKEFQEGYELAKEHYNPHTGRTAKSFVHLTGARAEGMLCARSELNHKAFPGFKMIDWKGGKANVTY